MFGDIGVPELLIILAIVVLLFGVGRVGRLGKDLGTSIKEFRKAVSEEKEDGGTTAMPASTLQSPPAPLSIAAPAAAEPEPQKPPPAIF
jgi:sec-independent protein translocase protein TatA